MLWTIVAYSYVALIIVILFLIAYNKEPLSASEQMKNDNEQVKAVSRTDYRKTVRSMWMARGIVLLLVALALLSLYADEVSAFLRWYMTARW